jgi:hypothetical protein
VIAPIWAKPKYPGDAVRMQMLIRDDPRFGPEIGDIRIQHYAGMKGGDKVRVAVFLPGVSVCSSRRHTEDRARVQQLVSGRRQAEGRRSV